MVGAARVNDLGAPLHPRILEATHRLYEDIIDKALVACERSQTREGRWVVTRLQIHLDPHNDPRWTLVFAGEQLPLRVARMKPVLRWVPK